MFNEAEGPLNWESEAKRQTSPSEQDEDGVGMSAEWAQHINVWSSNQPLGPSLATDMVPSSTRASNP